MPAIQPEAPALLDAAIDYLERELLPTLAGYHRFQCRVTVNVLAQVRRELALAPGHADAERARLVALLGAEPDDPDRDRDALSRELAARIRTGDIALDDPALLDHLRKSLVEALRINNPRWLGDPDAPGEPDRR
jgi:hypothetical protein